MPSHRQRVRQSEKYGSRQENLTDFVCAFYGPVQKIPAQHIGGSKKHQYHQHTHSDVTEGVGDLANEFLDYVYHLTKGSLTPRS
jgi:hypothetical protein